MKKISFLSAIIISFLFLACNDTEVENLDTDLKFIDLEIPNSISYGNNFRTKDVETEDVIVEISVLNSLNEEIEGELIVTLPVNNDDYLVSMKVSDNIVEALGSDYDYWSNLHGLDNQRLLKSSCIADCQEAFTDDEGNKIKGRGACKAGCWAKIAIAAAAVVATIVAS